MWAYESPPWSSSSSSGASGSRSGRRAPEDDITAWTDTWNENSQDFWRRTLAGSLFTGRQADPSVLVFQNDVDGVLFSVPICRYNEVASVALEE